MRGMRVPGVGVSCPVCRVPPPQHSPLRHSGLLLSKPQGGTSEGTTFPGQWISRPGTIWIFLVVPL